MSRREQRSLSWPEFREQLKSQTSVQSIVSHRQARACRPLLLRDGTIGYHVRPLRDDDCFAAAVATVLQVPIDEVPDPRVDKRRRAGEAIDEIARTFWLDWNRRLSERGLRMTAHPTPPTKRRRWIGIVPFLGAFQDHCLVMTRDGLLFDPVPPVAVNGRLVRRFNPADVRSGLTFERVNTHPRSRRSNTPWPT